MQEENRASSLQKSIRDRESDLDDLKIDVKRVSFFVINQIYSYHLY